MDMRMSGAEHSAASAALANQESIQESKLRAMRGAVDLYRGRLGLDFRKGALRCSPSCSSHMLRPLTAPQHMQNLTPVAAVQRRRRSCCWCSHTSTPTTISESSSWGCM